MRGHLYNASRTAAGIQAQRKRLDSIRNLDWVSNALINVWFQVGGGCSGARRFGGRVQRNSRNSRFWHPPTATQQACFQECDEAIAPTSNLIQQGHWSKKYDLEPETLGVGMCGKVKCVKDRISGERFALKRLHRGFAFRYNEVEIQSSLKHPHLCRLHEVYEDDDGLHLVMDLCWGGVLTSWLESSGRYTEPRAAAACSQMLIAIAYMHEQLICHKDVKLDNWVYSDMSTDASLKLIDFGLSQKMTCEPMSGFEGSAAYMAPEMYQGEFNEKVDIWGIGVIMYRLLSGTLPFEGLNESQIVHRFLTFGFPFDTPVWSEVSDSAKDFVQALLEEEPDDRPTAAEAAEHPWLRSMRA